MWNDSRIKPMEAGNALGDTRLSALPIPAGTVARGQPWAGDPLVSGRANGRLVAKSPVPVTPALLNRGQERFNVNCSPCHGVTGNGQGAIVKRGFPAPPDYAIRRLRDAPLGHFFDVQTNGYGIMYSYAQRVTPEDRWAIAAYIRVLQQSRPEVPEETGKEERLRARETGIMERRR